MSSVTAKKSTKKLKREEKKRKLAELQEQLRTAQAEELQKQQATAPQEQRPVKRRKKLKTKKDTEGTATTTTTATPTPPTPSPGAADTPSENPFPRLPGLPLHDPQRPKDILFQIPIAYPYSPPNAKLTKRILKLVNGATLEKRVVKGIRQCGLAMRRNKKGLMVLAANISPMDCIAHVPGVCENKGIPYIWVPSRFHLGNATVSKRPCSAVLVLDGELSEKQRKKFNKAVSLVKGKLKRYTHAYE
eukprot:NODE_344_length_923_cov_414.380653_g336_i0.p1 GENE.NODE_344_length_923_cov_414.380653_g336_i0~~NODE_344_length_923_cov_414.380653_g336_i0.p1  ORF type:complete len:246 (-),score=62.05 NODE_344_length_923_cov_414.380653_g336_i0:95-832(-)